MDDVLFSDLVLIVDDGTEFQCHKHLLYYISEYFKCLLTSHFKEKLSNRIEIKDLSSNALSTIIKYIYKKEYILNSNDLPDLLNGIELFGLTDFKDIVDKWISDNVDMFENKHLLSLFELFNLKMSLRCFRNNMLIGMVTSMGGHPSRYHYYCGYTVNDGRGLSINMKNYIQKSIIGCMMSTECDSHHILMCITNGNNNTHYNIDLCADRLSLHNISHICDKKINTFLIDNKNYWIIYCDTVCEYTLYSDTTSITLEVDFNSWKPYNFIISNNKLYSILENKIVIYSIEEMRCIKTINNTTLISDNIIVVNDIIYIIVSCDQDILIYDLNCVLIYEYTFHSSIYCKVHDECRGEYYINNVCEINDKIYISVLFRSRDPTITIDCDKYINVNRDQYVRASQVTRCVICNEIILNCKCKVNREWDNFHTDKVNSLFYKDHTCNCTFNKCIYQHSNYIETIIFEYDISTNIINVISQLSGKDLYLTVFENKLYAINSEWPHMLGVYNGNIWTELMSSFYTSHIDRFFKSPIDINGFTLMRDV